MSNQKPNNPPGGKSSTPAKADSAKPAPSTKAEAGKPAGVGVAAAAPGEKIKVPPLFRSIDWMTFAVTTLVVFLGYLYTLAPQVTLQDSGELAVASYYAGIPHPPGYPVWTVYTWLFTLLPISNIAYRVAIGHALSAALACGIVALMVSRGSSMLLEGVAELRNIERRKENAICIISGFVGGMLIGFNGFMWSQAIIVEVYCLSVLSLAGVMACLMRWIHAPHQHRYLYWAFFWFGICFNNHQSLLVIALGLEVAILVTQPKLGRDLFFWNWLIWIGGLVMAQMGYISMLKDNPPVMIIFCIIGFGSLVVWVVTAVKTKKQPIEIARDFVLVTAISCVLLIVATITSHVTLFYRGESLKLKVMPFAVFCLFAAASIGALVYLIRQTAKHGKEWWQALVCGGAWTFGAAFYLYMPIAGMSNPPLQWGYPRTVQGFWHAFTRGQYERIHPTFGSGNIVDEVRRYIDQIGMYSMGVLEEFNVVYVLIGLVPFLFFMRMQKRERAWTIGNVAIYLTLSFFLLYLLNPAPDRQSRDLNKVFFTAGHVMVAMGIGYGLSLLAGTLVTNYQRFRTWALWGFGGAAAVAFIFLADTLWSTPNPVDRMTAYFSLGLALAATAVVAIARDKAPLKQLLFIFALMPLWSVFSHWEKNEQRGHLFGYWFGHDMFTPPFTGPDGKLTYDNKLRAEMMKKPGGNLIYPEMDRDAVVYGGTDPGRFNPTYMIFCESFLPAKYKAYDPAFDRRDCYLITQNALADGTYLNYIRAHYNRSDQVQYDTPFFQEMLRGPREQAENTYTNILSRMVIPLDRFFTKLGDNIEKNRRAGSSFFTETDFTDLPGFVNRLKPGAQQTPLGNFLYGQFSKADQEMLAGGADEKRVRRSLAKALNHYLNQEQATNKVVEAKRAQTNVLGREIAILNDVIKSELLAKKTAQKAALETEIKTLGDAAAKDLLSKKRADLAVVENEIKELATVPGQIQQRTSEIQKLSAEIAGLAAVSPLFTAERFQGVPLTDHLQRFLKENPQLHSRIRMNRLLLEAAFPAMIAKSVGGVYPDREILTATPEDSQKAFSEYLNDAQRRLDHDRRFPNEPKQIRPGEDVRMIDNKVQVSGQVAVMAINALITKIMFDKNPGHEFYVEESFPLDWMYPYLTPFSVIMKINRQPLKELDDEIVRRDHEFWSKYSDQLIGNWITYDTSISNICEFVEQVYIHRKYRNVKVGSAVINPDPKFVRDDDAQKAFSKLRSSIGGVYNWRYSDALNKLIALQSRPPAEHATNIVEMQRLDAERQRMYREADFAFRQAYAYCPYSPEALFRYSMLLVNNRRFDEALMLAKTSLKLDPDNGQIELLISQIQDFRKQTPGVGPPNWSQITDDLEQLEKQAAADPVNTGIVPALFERYLQQQQVPKALALIDRMVDHPRVDGNGLMLAAQCYNRLGDLGRVEKVLLKVVALSPETPEAWFDLAGVQMLLNKQSNALGSLRQAMTHNAQRLAKNPSALNLYTNLAADPRFAGMRQNPEFLKILAELKPQ